MDLPDAPMIGVEERLPGGLATAEEALLDPRRLDAALVDTGVPPANASFDLTWSREEMWIGVEAVLLGCILLEVRGVSASFCGERGRSAARTVVVDAVL